MPRPAVDASKKTSFHWKAPTEVPPPETPKKKKRSLLCDEFLDQQELEATQPLVDVGSLSEDKSEDSSDFDAEGDFRELVADAIRKHGLENVRSWFTVECRRFKKPKLEKGK